MNGTSVSGTAKILDTTDTILWRMLKKLTDRARAEASFEGVKRIGVDETSKRRGHNYLTTFVDLDKKRALFCCENRDSTTVEQFVQDLAEHGADPENIETVTCDLSPAYKAGIEQSLPNATRIVDKFHVMQIANRQLDLVRSAEARESSEKKKLLSGTKYIWLKREENLTDKQLDKKRNLAKESLKTGRAAAMVETLRRMYEQCKKPSRGKS